MTYAALNPAVPAPLPPLTRLGITQRVVAWTIICSVAATPSFIIASGEADRGAMVLGVLIFIALYVATSCTRFARRLFRKPFMKISMQIGYGLRMLLAIPVPPLWGADLFPGIIAVGVTEWLIGIGYTSFDNGTNQAFVATLIATLLQGVLLNIVVGVVVLICYGIQRLTRKHPHAPQPRGFEVLPMAQTAETSKISADESAISTYDEQNR